MRAKAIACIRKSLVLVPTVERGLREITFCSMAIVGRSFDKIIQAFAHSA